MTNPNNLQPQGEAEPQRVQEVGGAAVHLASQSEANDSYPASNQVPRRPTDSWALEGPHRTWLGFDGQTGEPKSG